MNKIIPALCLTALLAACSASETEPQSLETKPVETVSLETAPAETPPVEPMTAAAAMTTEMPFEAVESNLREALKKRDLNLFTVVDHGAGAKSVGMDIGQSKLFIFGSPKSGTPLMMANPEMGMALPMKVLIFTNEQGQVAVRHTDIKAVAQQYGLTDQGERLAKIETTLANISSEAIAKPQ